ncbi:MAG: serine/threonine protein kinase [Gemmatimonadaceae bacterium]|nr:serine/threonine protein kinase [Gemmatimonadaceae bacterium]
MPERYLGRQLGRFRIDSVIGSGGFAWVYKGYDPELDIPVAVKVLKPQFGGEPNFETRFRREASTAAKLRHPNIIRILAVGRQEDAVYFVMDYLPTGLDDRLRIMGTLPESLVIRLGMDVSAALAFAHREGVIHRDIKTDNILFDEHGNAIVADFGIARAVSGYTEQTGTNMVVGTPQYFSPEQARGQQLDGRADIYSLGVTLFKAATGVLPFQGDDWYDIARQHVEEPPPKPRAFNPALSRGIERVILKCLEKNPANRYPTGDALHTELTQLLGRASNPDGDATVVMPTPVSVRRATPPPVPVAAAVVPRRRRSGIWSGMVVTAIVLLVAAFVLSTTRGRARPPVPSQGALAPSRDSNRATSPAGTTGVVAMHPDSAPASSTTTALPAAAAGAITHELRIEGPRGAEIWFDGSRVGRGRWRSENVEPGEHAVAARVQSVAGCPTARQDSSVRVHGSGITTIALDPRPCGYLAIDALPVGARWVVTSATGEVVASGVIPQPHPAVVPIGAYTLRVSAPYCADYHADIAVRSAETHRERLRLICG